MEEVTLGEGAITMEGGDTATTTIMGGAHTTITTTAAGLVGGVGGGAGAGDRMDILATIGESNFSFSYCLLFFLYFQFDSE